MLRRPARSARRITVALVLTTAAFAVAPATGAGAAPAHSRHHAHLAHRKIATTGPEAIDRRLLADIQALRHAYGLGPLRTDLRFQRVATDWSRQQWEQRALSHNPSFVQQLLRATRGRAHHLAENVGLISEPATTGSTALADRLFRAYVDSPQHLRNLLDPRLHVVGIGTLEARTSTQVTVINTCDFTDRSRA